MHLTRKPLPTNFLLVLLSLLTLAIDVFSQPTMKIGTGMTSKLLDANTIHNNLTKGAKPYRLTEISSLPKPSNLNDSQANTCRTSTFYMTLPAGTGEKIALQKVQTTQDDNFLVAGTVTLSDNSQEGAIIKMTNAGVILSQTRIRVTGKSTYLYSMKVMLNGNIAIAGSIQDGSNLFLSLSYCPI